MTIVINNLRKLVYLPARFAADGQVLALLPGRNEVDYDFAAFAAAMPDRAAKVGAHLHIETRRGMPSLPAPISPADEPTSSAPPANPFAGMTIAKVRAELESVEDAEMLEGFVGADPRPKIREAVQARIAAIRGA